MVGYPYRNDWILARAGMASRGFLPAVGASFLASDPETASKLAPTDLESGFGLVMLVSVIYTVLKSSFNRGDDRHGLGDGSLALDHEVDGAILDGVLAHVFAGHALEQHWVGLVDGGG